MIIKKVDYEIIKDCALRLKYLKDFYYTTNIFISNKKDADNLAGII